MPLVLLPLVSDDRFAVRPPDVACVRGALPGGRFRPRGGAGVHGLPVY